MAEVIRMPKMSDTMEEGVISAWLKKEGDEVVSGDILAEVETDKATMELESYHDGVLLYIGVKEKEAIAVDGILAVIGEKGEDYKPLLKESTHEEAVGTNEMTRHEETLQSPANKIDTSQIKAQIIRMPKMSDTMEEGVIATWLKKEGDEVVSGDILAEVETDKATMELEAYEDGILLYKAVEDGKGVAVDGIIAIIGEKDADYKALLESEANPKPKVNEEIEGKENTTSTTKHKEETPLTSESANDNRIKISPLARSIASKKGIDLTALKGSGTEGRIIKRDVENYSAEDITPASPKTNKKEVPSGIQLPQVVGHENSEKISLSQMRKAIAKRLSESKFSAPHFYLTMEINMDKAMTARKSMNEISPIKISFNDLVIKAVAAAIRKNPGVNVSWSGDHLIQHHHIHIGVAVAIPEGLIVPVIKFADNKTLSHISAEVKDLAGKAKDKQLQPEEFTGNTFTISNLGMFGIEEFTAIINPPDACILAVSGIKETPIVKEGKITSGHVMKITLSCDHRAVDGAVGASFLASVREFLEDPIRILV